MRDPGEKWQRDLERWCEPYLDAFEHKVRRRWAPVYLRGLLLPGDRKSIEPIVERVAPAEKEQIHHFVATSKCRRSQPDVPLTLPAVRRMLVRWLVAPVACPNCAHAVRPLVPI